MDRFPAFALLLSGLACAASANPPPDTALWNDDKTAAVTATPGDAGTSVTAYVLQADGAFLQVDLSAVEAANFGKLGRRPTDFERFETRPKRWIDRQDGLLQIVIQTQAWRAGQRYTVSEPLVFRPDGAVVWR